MDEAQPSIPGLPGPEGIETEKSDNGLQPEDGSADLAGLRDQFFAGAVSPAVIVSGGSTIADSRRVAATPQREDDARRYFYLTNRLNLNGVLSSRVVAPREAYDKYYNDLLAQCPGWVPLFLAAPPQSLVNAVASERGSGGPVIVEFSGDVDGVVTPDDSHYAYAPAIPLCDAVAIHVPDKKALRELIARAYKNIHSFDDLIQITPELFADGAEIGMPTSPCSAGAVDWQLIDRVRGAVSAAVSAAESGEQLALVAQCLGANVSRETTDETISWLKKSILNDFEPAAQSASDVEAATPDSVLFRAAYGALARVDASAAWSPRAFLDEVIQIVADDSMQLSRDEIDRNLARVRQIIDVEEEFKPFSSKGGLVTAKAMLLFSLRVDLAELNSWSAEETGADDATRIVAAILAGRLRGLAREDVTLRSKELDDITARWAVRVAANGEGSLGDATFVPQRDRTELFVDGIVVSHAEALLPDPAVIYKAVDESDRREVRVKVANIMEWPVTKVIRISGAYDVRRYDSGSVIETTGDVTSFQDVNESDFIQRLSETRRDRKRVLQALASARDAKDK